MNDTLKYKDYFASISYSMEDEVFHGKIIGINDLITFEGRSVTELKKAFKEATEDYLTTCKEMNKQPDKTYKGSFNVRVPASMHKKAALMASQKNITLNELMKVAITIAIKHEREVDQTLEQLHEKAI